ncbi:unnamed protein product [Blepharisma stoltei]|uniref:Uncharacterized protein n=1 Tax=Blepharisma stoltei TaxID=1481888 RepID=A0AAU9K406_9CILI|nr:unnamed protein product [Blepharisma stoltei]
MHFIIKSAKIQVNRLWKLAHFRSILAEMLGSNELELDVIYKNRHLSEEIGFTLEQLGLVNNCRIVAFKRLKGC